MSPEQDTLLASDNGAPWCQPTPELDDGELLLELPLLRLCTDGAAAFEAGGVIVTSAASAPGKLPKAPNARASSNNTNTRAGSEDFSKLRSEVSV